MMHPIVVMTIAALILTAASATFAQFYFDGPPRPCGPRLALTKRLDSIGERQVWVGIRYPQGLTELWVKKLGDKPSWTIFITRPTGDSCVVGYGGASQAGRHGTFYGEGDTL